MKLYNLPCTDVLNTLKRDDVKMIFADPPDNIGYHYSSYNDKLPEDIYFGWIRDWLRQSMEIAPIIWLSYNAIHMVEMNYIVRTLLKRYPIYEPRHLIWHYTFGNCQQKDFTNAFRPILRLSRYDAVFYPDSVREESTRQKIDDARANPNGKVPDDVFQIPRVTGNSAERRQHHPTQHPDALIKKLILFSTQVGDTVMDLFGGTGTVMRNCHRLDRDCITTETDKEYCWHISQENNKIEILTSV